MAKLLSDKAARRTAEAVRWVEGQPQDHSRLAVPRESLAVEFCRYQLAAALAAGGTATAYRVIWENEAYTAKTDWPTITVVDFHGNQTGAIGDRGLAIKAIDREEWEIFQPDTTRKPVHWPLAAFDKEDSSLSDDSFNQDYNLAWDLEGQDYVGDLANAGVSVLSKSAWNDPCLQFDQAGLWRIDMSHVVQKGPSNWPSVSWSTGTTSTDSGHSHTHDKWNPTNTPMLVAQTNTDYLPPGGSWTRAWALVLYSKIHIAEYGSDLYRSSAFALYEFDAGTQLKMWGAAAPVGLCTSSTEARYYNSNGTGIIAERIGPRVT